MFTAANVMKRNERQSNETRKTKRRDTVKEGDFSFVHTTHILMYNADVYVSSHYYITVENAICVLLCNFTFTSLFFSFSPICISQTRFKRLSGFLGMSSGIQQKTDATSTCCAVVALPSTNVYMCALALVKRRKCFNKIKNSGRSSKLMILEWKLELFTKIELWGNVIISRLSPSLNKYLH